jgi:hypothetical protein
MKLTKRHWLYFSEHAIYPPHIPHHHPLDHQFITSTNFLWLWHLYIYVRTMLQNSNNINTWKINHLTIIFSQQMNIFSYILSFVKECCIGITLGPVWNEGLKNTGMKVLTVNFHQPSHKFTYNVGIDLLFQPLELPPVYNKFTLACRFWSLLFTQEIYAKEETFGISSSSTLEEDHEARQESIQVMNMTPNDPSVVWTSLGPLLRWVSGPTIRWAPGTTRLVLHGTCWRGAQGLQRNSTQLGSCTCPDPCKLLLAVHD